MQRLLHRWFIQYNPLYLVSAALMLVGVIALSHELSARHDALGLLGLGAIAELYAWALIGSAALLMRIGSRRPAVMLALLAAFYQSDPTLHTETCAHLGLAGAFGTMIWVVGFFAKLRALAWAMRLSLSRSAIAVALFGAAGIAILPWTIYALSARLTSTIVGAWIFVLFAAALWSRRSITSNVGLDGWAAFVARRSLRATWIGWGIIALLHVLFLWVQYPGALDVRVLAPVALLLATRACARESTVWMLVVATLGLVAIALPPLFAATAGMAAVVLVIRALRQPSIREPTRVATSLGPYRDAADASAPPLATVAFVRAERAAMLRLFAGALTCLYLAHWTHAWTDGPWPSHVWWVDLWFAAAALIWTKLLRDRTPLAMLTATALHYAVQIRLVTAPSTTFEWALACIVAGFSLLLAALVASVRHRDLGLEIEHADHRVQIPGAKSERSRAP